MLALFATRNSDNIRFKDNKRFSCFLPQIHKSQDDTLTAGKRVPENESSTTEPFQLNEKSETKGVSKYQCGLRFMFI